MLTDLDVTVWWQIFPHEDILPCSVSHKLISLVFGYRLYYSQQGVRCYIPLKPVFNWDYTNNVLIGSSHYYYVSSSSQLHKICCRMSGIQLYSAWLCSNIVLQQFHISCLMSHIIYFTLFMFFYICSKTADCARQWLTAMVEVIMHAVGKLLTGY